MELFKLHGTIDVDNSEANKSLDETSQKGQQTQSKLSKFFSGIGKGAAVVGKTVATGLAVGGAAMGTLTVKAMNLGGELEQNMGGSEAVFGKYAGKMQDTAKKAFSNMGLSTSDYLATANKMGALFQGAGFSIKDSMDISSDAMQRAADVASIMGIDTGAAMEAIAGAAKGNFTMMDNLGVAMNDTTLNAYALEKGINKTTQEMTNQEKIGLAMEMFMDKTAYAAGNYAKENETLAGSLGTAKAALTNFLDGSGDVESLVTSFSNLANVVVRDLGKLAPRLVTGITDIINQVMPMLPPLIQQILPVIIEGAVSLINGLVSAFPSIISAIMGVLPSLIQGMQSIIGALIQALPQIIQALVSALPSLLPHLISGLISVIVMLCTMLPDIIQPIIDYLPEIIVAIVETLVGNLPRLIVGAKRLISGLISAFPQILAALWEAIKGIFGTLGSKMAEWFKPVTDWFKSAWEKLTGIVTSVFETIKKVISTAFKLIGSIISAAFQIITLPFRFIWENCKEYVFAAFEWIKSKIKIAIDFIKNIVQVGFNFVKEKIIKPINEAKNKVVEAFENVKNKVQEKISAVKSKVSSIFDSIKSKISNVVNSIRTTVSNVFNKVKDAMEKPINKAKDTIKGIVDKIKGFFSGLKLKFPNIKLPHFGISPSGWKIGDLLKGSIPKLSIKWYAEAMNNPMIMTKPTVFGYDAASGKLLGGGEAGSEVVAGTSTLMRMIQAAVSSQNDAVVYYLQKLIEILAAYFPQVIEALDMDIVLNDGVLVGRLAPAMNVELGKISSRKDRGR